MSRSTASASCHARLHCPGRLPPPRLRSASRFHAAPGSSTALENGIEERNTSTGRIAGTARSSPAEGWCDNGGLPRRLPCRRISGRLASVRTEDTRPLARCRRRHRALRFRGAPEDRIASPFQQGSAHLRLEARRSRPLAGAMRSRQAAAFGGIVDRRLADCDGIGSRDAWRWSAGRMELQMLAGWRATPPVARSAISAGPSVSLRPSARSRLPDAEMAGRRQLSLREQNRCSHIHEPQRIREPSPISSRVAFSRTRRNPLANGGYPPRGEAPARIFRARRTQPGVPK